MVAAADAEAKNLDQAGEPRYRTGPQFFAVCVRPGPRSSATRTAGGELSRAAGQDQIEGEAGLAGAGRAADQDFAACPP